jgi:hypothetical protein
MELVKGHRDAVVLDALYNETGNPAEKRGAARELDRMVNAIESAPEKAKQSKSLRQ